MNRKRMLLAIGGLTLVLAAGLLVATSRAAPPNQDDPMGARANVTAIAPQPVVRVQDLAQETVLYTVHQGDYESAIGSVLKLRQLSESQGLTSPSDVGYFVYLNNPAIGRENDRLIEIRLSVDPGALASEADVKAAAAELGLGTTGVKEVGPTRVASIAKGKGVADPSALWNDVYAYAESAGLDPESAGPVERFSSISAIPATCTYDELGTELMVGIL